MTYIDALAAKLKPYVLPDDSLQVILLENGLEESDDYEVASKKVLTKCLIAALEQCKTLTEESDNGSTQKYDTASIDKRITLLKEEIGDKSGRPQSVFLGEYW